VPTYDGTGILKRMQGRRMASNELDPEKIKADSNDQSFLNSVIIGSFGKSSTQAL
jgi:hypothetical protein